MSFISLCFVRILYVLLVYSCLFFFNDPATTEIYTLSLHDALPISAGRAFIMPDDSLLYVAVADVYLDQTVRLEGEGVTPDVVVPFPIEYAQGADPQKERAIATALGLLNSPSP